MLSRDKEARESWSRTAEYEFGALAAPFIVGLGKIGITGTLGKFLGGLGAVIIGTGLSLAAGLLFRPKVPEPASGQIETQQSVPERTFIYGRLEVSGPLAFKKLKNNTSILHKIVLLHDGEVDAFETLKLDDRIVTLNEDGYVTNSFIQDSVKRVQVFLHSGADNQPADALMMANFPGLWTSEHRLRGIAYAVIVCHGVGAEDFIGAYPNGEPVFKSVIRGRRLWDPRDGDQDPDVPATWLWTDNAALAVLDWVCMHPKGYGIDRAKIDIASFEARADLCDELVPLKTGGSERRYRVATQVSLKEPRTDVLARLREACDAHLYITGEGKWALRGGSWTAPTVTLDTDLGHVIEAEMRDGMDALSRYNELAVTFLSPNHNYGKAECDPWQGIDDPEFLTGKVVTQALDLLQVPSHGQARRLAKIRMAFDNPDWLATARTNFYGLHCIGERNVTFNWAEPTETLNGVFWLEPQMTMLENGTGMQVTLRSADETSYDWDEYSEEGAAPPILPPEDAEFEEGVPPDNAENFAATGGVRSVLLSWEVPSDPAFYIARVWRSADGATFDDAVEVSGPRYLPRLADPGDMMTFLDPVPAGDYDYWLTAENAVGDRNMPLGPVNATADATGEYFVFDDFGNRLSDNAGAFITMPVGA